MTYYIDLNPLPLVTLGIPVKNRAWYIDKVLKAIEDLDYPKNKIKIIFVDDYSKDGTYETIISWTQKNKSKFHGIRVIRERSNIPKARNLCIKHMEGKYILFWDSDVIPPESLLKKMIETMEKQGNIGIIGADYFYDPYIEEASNKTNVNTETHAIYMGFTLIKRKILDLIGGFNEDLTVGEDTDFCIRVKENTKFKIYWSSEPVLHLKREEDLRKGVTGLFKWLKFNFRTRGKEYATTFKNLPRLLKIRIIYYLLLPQIFITTPIIIYQLTLTPIVAPLLILITYLAYLTPGMYLEVKGSALKRGLVRFFRFNMPTGIALSYGIIFHSMKSIFGKRR